MEDQAILQGEFLRLEHDVVRVEDRLIVGDAPGFVSNDTVAMLAARACMVSIAVKDDLLVDHRIPCGLACLRSDTATRSDSNLKRWKVDGSVRDHTSM